MQEILYLWWGKHRILLDSNKKSTIIAANLKQHCDYERDYEGGKEENSNHSNPETTDLCQTITYYYSNTTIETPVPLVCEQAPFTEDKSRLSNTL